MSLPLVLKPNDVIEIKLGEKDYNEITTTLDALGFAPNVRKVKFHLSEIYFEDGSAWIAGSYMPEVKNRIDRHVFSDV